MFLIGSIVLLFVSCRQEYAVEWIIIGDLDVKTIIIKSQNDNGFVFSAKTLKPGITKTIRIPRGLKYVFEGYPVTVSMASYPYLQSNQEEMEIYLFPSDIIAVDGKVIFPENKNIVAYYYDYLNDGKIYTVVSKDNYINLNDTVLLADDPSIDMILQEIEKIDCTYYSSFETKYKLRGYSDHIEHGGFIVKSGIDNAIIWLTPSY
jgi:hypothetical protein